MAISAGSVKELREKTGAGMMDCKKALQETDGDFEKAIDFLRKKGIASASKKAGREANDGSVTAYIHGDGKIGVLVEISCETDFVARTEQFRDFSKDIAMHVAAASPRWLSEEQVPGDVVAREKEIIIDQMKSQGKPQNVVEKIAEGKLKKFYSENCLLKQAFVKDPDKTVEEYVKEQIGSLGENILIRRFVRFVLGESIEGTH